MIFVVQEYQSRESYERILIISLKYTTSINVTKHFIRARTQVRKSTSNGLLSNGWSSHGSSDIAIEQHDFQHRTHSYSIIHHVKADDNDTCDGSMAGIKVVFEREARVKFSSFLCVCLFVLSNYCICCRFVVDVLCVNYYYILK